MTRNSPATPIPGRVAFEISADLRRRAESVVDAIRSDPDKKKHAPALVEVVLEMTSNGLIRVRDPEAPIEGDA